MRSLWSFCRRAKSVSSRFVMDSENADDYLEWCRSHGTDPSDESAEFYVEQTDIEQMDRQVMDDDSYGIWN